MQNNTKNQNYFKYIFKHSTFLSHIFIPSIIIIFLITTFAIIAPNFLQEKLAFIQSKIFDNASWIYILCVSFFVFFMIALAMSKFGEIRLGGADEKPDFTFLSWISMLFAAGMGVGLMFFGVAEPLSHAANYKILPNEIVQKEAMLHTIFHWGIHPWAIYGVIALAMAYFSFRHDMPLSLRSTLYPFLKDKIGGFWGHTIEILALIATIFGIATTLGYSALQLNAGFIALNITKELSFTFQAIIIVVVISLSTISSISGVGKGVKILSELNLSLAIFLMLFILVCSSPSEILADFSSNIGHYLNNLVNLSFKTFAYDKDNLKWFHSWTIFYWAWWLAWGPLVGYFIAKISRGRSIREFIFGVLVVPTSLNVLWFSIFGNSALKIDLLNNGILSDLVSKPEALLFKFLEFFPFSTISSILAMIILAMFFITSADSGILVLNTIASGGKDGAKKWQNILWGVILATLSIALLRSGGLDAVSGFTLIVTMPFLALMVFMCFSLLKGLHIDEEYFNKGFTRSSVFWSGEFWQQRLDMIMLQPQKKDIELFMKNNVLAAMNELKSVLTQKYGLKAFIIYKNNDFSSIKLEIEKEFAKNFIYGVEITKKEVNKTLIKDKKLPIFSKRYIWEPMTFFGDGRLGYDIKYMTQNEIIADILKQYERYLSLLDDDKNDLVVADLDL